MNSEIDIAVIGGGAAGVFAAVNVARRSADKSIIVFEAGRKALSKVLISGGGRCNVTNHTLETGLLVQNYPRGGKELLGPFNTFGVRETFAWFEERGVPLKVENDRRVFPGSNSSRTIADCLLREAREHNVRILTGEKVYRVDQEEDSGKFLIETGNTRYLASTLLIASGGNDKSFALAESLGHTIIPPVPSLFTFTIHDPLITGLSGVSFPVVKASLNIKGKKFLHEAPLLITHWGLSGPAVIVLSSKAARELHAAGYKTDLTVNFIPRLKVEDAKKLLTEYRSGSLNRQLNKVNPFSFPASFWEKFISVLFPESKLLYQNLSKARIEHIVEKLSSYCFQIEGKGVFKEEFVTAGGVSLKEVNFKTMESKIVKNLFFAGEVLDMDGVTGGFNFQSAWTTGWIASQNMQV